MKKLKIKIEKTDIIIFFTVIFLLGGAFLAFYPAILTPDSVDQLSQFDNNYYFTSHPVLHSFLAGAVTKIFTVAGVSVIQIIIFAFIWTYACKLTRNGKNSSTFKVFQEIFTILICIIPINFMFSITIWKDIPYSYAALALAVYLYIGIKKNFKYSYLDIFLLSLAAVFVMKMRHNGIAITLFLIPLLMILNFIKQKKIKKTVCFAVIFSTLLIISYIPQWCCNIHETHFSSSVLLGSKIYGMSAMLDNNINLEESEYKFLNNIIPIEEWKQSYNGTNGLALFYTKNYNSEFLALNEKEFNQIFYKYAKQNIKVLIRHIATVNSITWSIKEYGPLTTFAADNSYISEMSGGKYDTHSQSLYLTKVYGNIINTVSNNKILYILIYRPAIPMYLSIICVLLIMIKKKKFSYCLVLFPMLINIATYVLLICSQDLRYYYLNFLTLYFTVLIVCNELLPVKDIENKGKDKRVKRNGKVLTIIPAYNESKNIQKVLDELKEDFSETDILVINDSSTDNTKDIVISNNVNCITTVFNLNYAYAVQTGIKYAEKYNYDYCLMFDGDGQHIAKEAKKLLDKIKETNCDIVIGSRYLEKGNYNAPKLRKIGTSFFTWLIKVSCNKKITDPLSGFQVINRRVIDKYSKIGEYPEFPDANLIIEMLLDGFQIEEVSVKMRNREFGESMHGGIIKPIKYMIVMLYTILILILNKLFGRRN